MAVRGLSNLPGREPACCGVCKRGTDDKFVDHANFFEWSGRAVRPSRHAAIQSAFFYIYAKVEPQGQPSLTDAVTLFQQPLIGRSRLSERKVLP